MPPVENLAAQIGGAVGKGLALLFPPKSIKPTKSEKVDAGNLDRVSSTKTKTTNESNSKTKYVSLWTQTYNPAHWKPVVSDRRKPMFMQPNYSSNDWTYYFGFQ